MKWILLIIGVVLLLETVSATDYYVDANTGNDSDDGKSLANAWLTLEYADGQISAGDILYLVDGTWNGENFVFSNSGNVTHSIKVEAYNGTPIMDGGDKTDLSSYGMSTTDLSYINISGLTIRNYGTGLYLARGGNIHIDDCEISDGHGYAIMFWDISNCSVKNSDLHDQGDNTIDMHSEYVGVNHILIQDNKIHDNPGTSGGSGHNLINFALFGQPMTHIDIIGNEIYNKGANGNPVFQTGAYGPAQFVTMRNNIFYDNNRGVSVNSLVDSYFMNNVVYSHTNQGIEGNYPTNVSVKNNIVTECGTGIWAPGGYNVSLSYNDVWNNTANYGTISPGATDISVNPLFADSINLDFHLNSTVGRWNGTAWVIDSITSPCVDAGDPNSSYSNEPAPNGGRINMGAHGNTEYASKSGTTYNVSGYVKYVNDTGIHNAYVENNVTSSDNTTNVSGYYILQDLANNTYSVSASRTGYVTNYSIATVSGSDVSNINVTLSETPPWTPSIYGTYYNSTNPIEITVKGYGDQSNLFSRTPIETDNNATSFRMMVVT